MDWILQQRVLNNHASFREEARFQGFCAMCGSRGPWHAHHVVYEQELARVGLDKPDRYDVRNSLRLCERCHSRHHSRIVTIPTAKLTDQNLVYAFIILGAFASDWLRRYYDDSVPDSRIAELESDNAHPALQSVRSRSSRRAAGHSA